MKKATPRGASDRVTYVRTFAGAWEGVSEWIEVTVDRFEDGWEASCSIGFPNADRWQWNTRKVFATRDEAASFAAAFAIVGEDLIAAVLRGEQPFMPQHAMATACERELAADPKLTALAQKVLDATDARARFSARDAHKRAEDEAQRAWYRAHDWRDFMPARRAA